MLLLLVLVGLVAAETNESNLECRSCIKVNAICHNITFVQELSAPFRKDIVITKLGILHSKNILYFAFEPNITDSEYYKVGYVNLDDKNVTGIVTGSNPKLNLRTFDFDQSNGVIFFGGGSAIYVSDSDSTVSFFSSGGDDIKSIVYKSNVYFVRAGENKIIEKRGELFRIYDQYKGVKDFVINKDNDMLYLTNNGLFISRFNTDLNVYLSKNAYFRGLAVDLDDSLYAWWIDGIYKVIKGKEYSRHKLVKIADINNIGALTFDNNNNILFTASKGLYKLTSTNNNDTIC